MWPYWVDWADTWTVTKVKVPVKTNTDSSKQPKSAIHPYLMHRIVHCQCNFIHSFKKNMIHSYSCHESLQLIGIRIFPPPPCNPLDMNAAQASYCMPCWSEIGFRPPLTGVDSGFVCFFYREAIYKLRLILKSTNQAIPLDFVILRSFVFFLRPLMESRYSCNAFLKKKKKSII